MTMHTQPRPAVAQQVEPAPASRAVRGWVYRLNVLESCANWLESRSRCTTLQIKSDPDEGGGYESLMRDYAESLRSIRAVLATPSAPVSEPAGAAHPDVAKMVEEAKQLLMEASDQAPMHKGRKSLLLAAINALGAAATQASEAPAIAQQAEPLTADVPTNGVTYVPPRIGQGISDNPYCNEPDCNDLSSNAMRWHNELIAQQPSPAPLCACKDRAAADCPGEWEPGCDLGNNAKHARVCPDDPSIDTAIALTTRPPEQSL